MVKKVFYGIFFILFVLSICISVYSYRKYRQCYIQSEYNRELATRATEENIRLKNTLHDIRETTNGIRDDTDRIGELNTGTINGIRDCINQLKQIREKVQIMENYCNSVNFTIGNIDN